MERRGKSGGCLGEEIGNIVAGDEWQPAYCIY